MLSPVSSHKSQSQQKEWEYDNHKGSSRIEKPPQAIHGKVAKALGPCGTGGQLVLLLAHKIQGQVQPDQKVEAADVLGKVPGVVALKVDSRRQVSWAVALDVVVLDVVVVVRVPGVAHEWIQDEGEGAVQPGPALGQHAALVDVLVHHERVRGHVEELHEEVQHAVGPGKVHKEQVRGARDGGGEVDEQMRPHDNVRLGAHDPLRPADVGLQQPVVDGLGKLQVPEIG